MKRVVITGVGAVSPLGIGTDRLFQGLVEDRSAVVNQRQEWQQEVSDLTSWVGAPLTEPLDPNRIPRKHRRFMGRVAAMAYVASLESLDKARVPEEMLASGRAGISFASTMGSVGALDRFFRTCFEEREIGRLPAGIFFRCMSHTCAANLAHALGITGRVLSPNAACASSLQAIMCGAEAIKNGKQDVMLCGGADELHVTVVSSFDMVRAASSHFNDRPQDTPRPFDEERDGIVCGEGAGALVLESEQSALAREAEILAEITGWSTNTGGTHMAQPHTESMTDCLRAALHAADLSPDAIDYVNAHATGTLQGDQAEAEALEAVFGEKGVPVSSFKGHLGHTLGASGALELIACLLMQKLRYLIPTRNLKTPGAGCGGLDHVTTLRPAEFDRFVKSSFAFGGIGSVLVLQRYRHG